MRTELILRRTTASIVVAGILVATLMTPCQAQIDSPPGEAPATSEPVSARATTTPLTTHVLEFGAVSLSVDGLGVYPGNTGYIEVEKPIGATVRGAYFAAATTGWSYHRLADLDIKLDGVGFIWDLETPSSIYSYNHWADVTSIVKPKIDAGGPGRVSFAVTENNSSATDGVILAVIFDDPGQTTSNTIALLFGAQDIAGDTFFIGLAEPLDKADPDLRLELSLGISYGYQTPTTCNQVSHIVVNGQLLTSSAGGQDDGVGANGGLLTVGGLDDLPDNPVPDASPCGIGYTVDDELYDLVPFAKTGDVAIVVDSWNPSNDDNIFFASLFLASTTAVVGEGIVLAPATAINEVGTSHTVTATVQDDDGNPVVGRDVSFTIVTGPHAGQTHIEQTDSNGQATFTYTGTLAGNDVIEASFVDSQGDTIVSNQVTKEWVILNQPPVAVCQDVLVAAGEVPNIDGGSYDPDGDLLTFTQDPSGAFSEAGIYEVTLTVIDSYGASDSCTAQVVVYDPSAGFVTGGGWIDSPVGAPVSNVVKVYATYATQDGGGAPYSDLVGFFQSPEIMFASETGYSWHPYDLQDFGAEITGVLAVEADGYHEFTLDSDDGSMLYIDGDLVVDNGDAHAPETASGSVDLTAGAHSFKIEFFECCGDPSGLDLILPDGVAMGDPSLVGKATFGFVSKYDKKGTGVPTGQTEFQFHAANLNFHSDSYEWLVVTGSNYAKFKGTGTINGFGAYKFQLWAGDDEPDTFRIKIWQETGGVESVVYDNGMEQPIGGGSIVVHAK